MQRFRIVILAVFLFGPVMHLGAQAKPSFALSLVKSEQNGWQMWKNQSLASLLEGFDSNLSVKVEGDRGGQQQAMRALLKQRVGDYKLSDFSVQFVSATEANMRFHAVYDRCEGHKCKHLDKWLSATYGFRQDRWVVLKIQDEASQ